MRLTSRFSQPFYAWQYLEKYYCLEKYDSCAKMVDFVSNKYWTDMFVHSDILNFQKTQLFWQVLLQHRETMEGGIFTKLTHSLDIQIYNNIDQNWSKQAMPFREECIKYILSIWTDVSSNLEHEF